MLKQVGNLVADDVPPGGEDDYVVLETHGEPRDFAAEGFAPRDHLELGQLLGAIDVERGAKVSGSRFYYLTGQGAELELALINLAMSTALRNGFTPMIPPALVKPAGDGGHRLPRPGRAGRLPPRADDLYLVGTPRCRWRRTTPTRSSTRPSCRCATPATARAIAARPARTARTPGASSGCTGSTRSRCSSSAPPSRGRQHQRLLAWEKEFIDALEIPFQVLELAAGDLGLSAARKYDCYGWLPTQDRYREITSTSNCTEFQARRLNIRARFDDRDGTGGHPERHAVRDDPDDHHDPGEPPAGRRLRSAPRGPAALPRRPRGADPPLISSAHHPVSDDPAWRPRLVAFDVDGTLVDRDGMLPDAVREAIALVCAAGVPVVLATGRAWHSTQPIFDLLGLPPGPTVCSNGAVIVQYPPQEIVQAITFDPREVISQVEEFAPGTLIAVEEIGRGYRLSDHFPDGDLTGEMIIEDVDQLSSRPVTRVILRDPTRSDEDFIALAEHLGLHGVTYFVGWSAWLDIAPEGVNKATALAEVAGDSAWSPRTCWPSATAATTSRCCAGPAAGSPSATPRPRCRPPPTPWLRGSPTAARWPSSAAGSASRDRPPCQRVVARTTTDADSRKRGQPAKPRYQSGPAGSSGASPGTAG